MTDASAWLRLARDKARQRMQHNDDLLRRVMVKAYDATGESPPFSAATMHWLALMALPQDWE